MADAERIQTYHLAQVNVALGKQTLDHPVMQAFVEQLDIINALADRSPGFIWRLQTEGGNATDLKLFDDPRIIYNMSVWDSLASLFDYVYHSDHTAVMAN